MSRAKKDYIKIPYLLHIICTKIKENIGGLIYNITILIGRMCCFCLHLHEKS